MSCLFGPQDVSFVLTAQWSRPMAAPMLDANCHQSPCLLERDSPGDSLSDATCDPTCSSQRAHGVASTSYLTSLCINMCFPLKQHLVHMSILLSLHPELLPAVKPGSGLLRA